MSNETTTARARRALFAAASALALAGIVAASAVILSQTAFAGSGMDTAKQSAAQRAALTRAAFGGAHHRAAVHLKHWKAPRAPRAQPAGPPRVVWTTVSAPASGGAPAPTAASPPPTTPPPTYLDDGNGTDD